MPWPRALGDQRVATVCTSGVRAGLTPHARAASPVAAAVRRQRTGYRPRPTRGWPPGAGGVGADRRDGTPRPDPGRSRPRFRTPSLETASCRFARRATAATGGGRLPVQRHDRGAASRTKCRRAKEGVAIRSRISGMELTGPGGGCRGRPCCPRDPDPAELPVLESSVLSRTLHPSSRSACSSAARSRRDRDHEARRARREVRDRPRRDGPDRRSLHRDWPAASLQVNAAPPHSCTSCRGASCTRPAA